MRATPTANITLGAAAETAGIATRTVEAATAEELEERVEALRLEFAALNEGQANWQLTHIALAGVGDGHKFLFSTIWGDADVVQDVASGLSPNPGLPAARMFFYDGSTPAALSAARNAVQQDKVATMFDAPLSASTVTLTQTLLAGASAGKRIMGGVLAFAEGAGPS